MDYQTLKVKFEQDICFIQIHRPEANNTINAQLIDEMTEVLNHCETEIKVVILEGSPEVFCFGADFKQMEQSFDQGNHADSQNPGPLYDLWLKLATGPYVTVAHVRGKANAGGIGFVAACDVVLSEEAAVYSLSELLFGLMPACVMPFLVRRMGYPKANYMTVMTQPISASKAMEWGLVDAIEANSSNLLRKQLLRLRRLSKSGISRYKAYLNNLDDALALAKPKALEANLQVFNDKENLDKIARFVKTGKFPWEEE